MDIAWTFQPGEVLCTAEMTVEMRKKANLFRPLRELQPL